MAVDGRLAVLNEIQIRLGYAFKEVQLLDRALHHASTGMENNERLEFLGDSVLQYAITLQLEEQFPTESVSFLSQTRSDLVKNDTLYEIAKEWRVADAIVLSTGARKSGVDSNKRLLADTMEAIFGAIQLDRGFQEACQVIQRLFDARLEKLTTVEEKHPKSQLQELLQSNNAPLPQYIVRRDPDTVDHQVLWTAACSLEDPECSTIGCGVTKQDAETVAAEKMLNHLRDCLVHD